MQLEMLRVSYLYDDIRWNKNRLLGLLWLLLPLPTARTSLPLRSTPLSSIACWFAALSSEFKAELDSPAEAAAAKACRTSSTEDVTLVGTTYREVPTTAYSRASSIVRLQTSNATTSEASVCDVHTGKGSLLPQSS